MGINGVMMQYFHWYIRNDGTLWKKLKNDAQHLKNIGVTSVWIPPAFKGTSKSDTGYGAYDLYDLGEFDQKGTVRTKYGTKDQLTEAIDELHKHDIKVYADIVINHKGGADETERFMAIEIDRKDKLTPISEPYEIEGWTKFNFEGRGGKYSDFKWNFQHFNGTDFNNENGKRCIYLIQHDNQGEPKAFEPYDYLMFANIDYKNSEVYEETFKWLDWFVNETKIDGIRIDGIKHINSWFIKDLLDYCKEHYGEDFYKVGEFWDKSTEKIENYLDTLEHKTDLFDVPLHYNFFNASEQGENFDMRTIFDNTMVATDPMNAVTFVDNHDSQLGQEVVGSCVQPWFKPLAYALILLRKDGYPCVFYADYYGTKGKYAMPSFQSEIDTLIYLRQNHSYGDQHDYIDDQHVIGWVRLGNEEHPYGCVVLMTNFEQAEKQMYVGEMHSGEVWIDKMGKTDERVTIDENGNGLFKVSGGAVSVYVSEAADQN